MSIDGDTHIGLVASPRGLAVAVSHAPHHATGLARGQRAGAVGHGLRFALPI